MPIYEYQCQACHQQIEVLRKISDAPLLDCPHCGEPSLKKKVSAAAFRLKGGGWYETDFKTGNKKNLVSDGAGASASDKSTATSLGESKSSETKSSETKSSETKSSETKSSETKSSETKSSETKSSASKSGDSKKTA